MKQVTLKVKESKYQFFMELIKSLDFVKLKEEDSTKEEILNGVKEAVEEMKQVKAGKIKTRTMKDFLNELRD
jgi:hypothetical protein